MKGVPQLPHGLEDPRLVRLLTDMLKNLTNVLDSNLYTFDEVTWQVPFDFYVPTAGNVPRTTSPGVVELKRAIAVGDPTTPVHFGATAWNWRGGGQVRVTDVDGLVAGTKYQLTFQVVG